MTATTDRRVLAVLAFALLGSTSAFAADATAFGNRLKEIAADNGVPMAFTSAEASGDNVVLKGVTLGAGADAAKLDALTFESVTGSDAEGWKAARVPFADIDTTEEGSQLKASGMTIEGLQIAAKGAPSTLPGEATFFFDSAAIKSVETTKNGKQIFALSGTSIENASDADGTVTSAFNLGDFKADFTTGDPEMVKTMTDLGYPQLSGGGSLQMSWNPKTGDLALSPFDLSVEKAGMLSLSYQIGGYTPSFIQSLGALQKQMAADPKGAQNSGMAILGLLSQLSIGSLSISFSDDSLTGRLLDFYAKQNGQSRDDLVNQLSQMAPAMLASLNNPAFQTEVGTAVSTFLKDPKSIAIEMNPDTPIQATQIMGAAMGAPQTLPTVLQLHVLANQAENGADDEGMSTDEPDADGDNDGTPQ